MAHLKQQERSQVPHCISVHSKSIIKENKNYYGGSRYYHKINNTWEITQYTKYVKKLAIDRWGGHCFSG